MKEEILKGKYKALENDYDLLWIKLKKIEKYIENINRNDMGFWVEDERGIDNFIDTKEDILRIIQGKD